MGSWTYQYDTLNRLLTTGQVSGGPYNGDYGCWTYDGFGNRTMDATSGTACNSSPSPISWAHDNTNNQITGTGSMTSGNYYDAAGDVTNDGFNQYLYDGAGRICAVENISTGALTGYVYDGEGNRVAKGGLSSFSCNMSSNGFSASTQYVLGIGGEQLTEQDGSNNWKHTNVFAGGALLATYGGAGQNSDTYFALTDWQGTKRAQTGVGGCLTGWSNLPYGNNGASSGPIPVSINGAVQCGLDATEHHYTGKIHDSETGNDDFGARYYASTAARWFSPDWAAAAEAVPYASYGSPQTLDLYAFVGNNPLSNVDPDGHQDYRAVSVDGVPGATDFSMMMGGDSMGVGAGSAAPTNSFDGMPYIWMGKGQLAITTFKPAQQQTPASPLTDDKGNIVNGANGTPALIPNGFDPKVVVKAGNRDVALDAVSPAVGGAATAADLAKFRRGGSWDLQRLSGNFDPRFIDSATILIGMYAASAGLSRGQILSIENEIAKGGKYASGTPMDSTYTHLPVRNITNTDIGMRLVLSGAIQ